MTTENEPDRIIVGQRISATKLQRAKELRQHMTEAEKRLWQYLRANRFNGLHFRRQQIIDGFIVDFYCHTPKLVIEVDGDIHQQQVEYDAERDKVLASRGLRLLRLKNEVVQNHLEVALAQIAALCD